MKEKIGKLLQDVRLSKGISVKDLCEFDNIFTIQQISNIETGKQMTSAERFIKLLSYYNLTYEEFLYLFEHDYLTSKFRLDRQLAEYFKRQNIDGLKQLEFEAANLFFKYKDVFFQHIEIMSRVSRTLIQNNFQHDIVKKDLKPIENYLMGVKEFNHYEVSLLGQCLSALDIDQALLLGEKAVHNIENRHTFYRNESDACVLLTNMAICCLDHQRYIDALKYLNQSIALAATNQDMTRSLHAQIIKEVIHFKLNDGLYNKQLLKYLVGVFKGLGWKDYSINVKKFVQKHGISLDNPK